MTRFFLGSVLAVAILAVIQVDAPAAGRGGGRVGRGFARHPISSRRFFSGVPYFPTAATVLPETTSSGDEEGEPEDVLYPMRLLSLKNESNERVMVSLQYRTRTAKGEWRWYPEDPAKSDKAVVYEIAPGDEVRLQHDDWYVKGSRVRIWAVSMGESGNEWMDNKTEDLWLVPEVRDGQHCYLAPEMETYTFTIAP